MMTISRIAHGQLVDDGAYAGVAGGGGGVAGAAHGLNNGGEAAAGAEPSSASPVRGPDHP
jgi:hypothetical protein